jgi:ROS/MUCR transcriptional regulator protein/Homeodomain-like domain
MKRNTQNSIPGFPWKGKFATRSEVNQYFSSEEGIQCLLCGRFMGTLNGHLQIVHGVTHEEYRERYGLPWRKGLVSRTTSKKYSTALNNRIKKGTFKPKPNQKAAVEKILAGLRRPDQPYLTGIKSENSRALSKQNVKYSRRDFEKVLSVMRKHKVTLREACMKYNLPGSATVLEYAESHPDFRKKLIDTYHGLPYAVQARADMFSPQFFRDLEKLKKKGIPATEIAKALGISYNTVRRRLKKIA